MSEIELIIKSILALIAVGFTLGVVFGIGGAFVKLGWKYAPYVAGVAFLVWVFA
jgi:hypothetical protein